jgi:hypothetical protein
VKRLSALFPLLISVAHAQCVMCYRTAAAQNMERARVMNTGIFIMMVPPFVILAGFLLLCWRRSQTFAEDSAPEDVARAPEACRVETHLDALALESKSTYEEARR